MPRSGSVALRFFELALVLVRFIHVASRIVTANRSLTAAEGLTWGYKTS